ncbi:MAG: dTDP-4-dehydrorhamnose 3,5-epimerase [Planctomycetota bacterium]|jgi:dTDP-4-dehydrorhamnose 3,5-epimerase
MGSMISIENLPLAGAAQLHSTGKPDSRGWFSRWFCQEELSELNGGRAIEQINSSFTSKQGTLRGVHFQVAPHAEDKLVRCIAGRVYDVMVDLRKGSLTFGQWHAVTLDEAEQNMVYIPRGFAHGFQTLTANCQLLYLHTANYAPDFQGGVHHASPELAIDWPLPIAEISERDASLTPFDQAFEGLEL